MSSYRDVRRFGTWLLLEPDELDPYLAERLGGEPLGRTFTTRVARRERSQAARRPIKAALLDQRTVAGLGNIYVDEALWRARIHPLRPARRARRGRARALPEAIKARSRRASRGRARACATTRPRTEARPMQDASASTAAKDDRARAAERRSTRSAPPVAARGTAPPASDSTRLRLRVEPAVAVEPPELRVAADRLAVDQDLRDRPAAGEIEELLAERRIVVEQHLLVLEPLPSSSAFARTQ